MWIFTSVECFITSASSPDTIAGEIEKTTPPMKTTKEL
jgi:hypothetical protein